MATDEQAFLRRLLATFKQEADEHIKAMSEALRALTDPVQSLKTAELVELLFREAHSLKGAARSVDMTQLEGLCHALETVLARLRGGNIALSVHLIDALYLVLDQLAQDIETSVAGKSVADHVALRQSLLRLAEPGGEATSHMSNAAGEAEYPQHTERGAAADAANAADTVRITTDKLMRMFEQIEELNAFAFAAGELTQELRGVHAVFSEWEREVEALEHEWGTNRYSAARMVGKPVLLREAVPDMPDLARYRSFVRTASHRLVQLEIRAEADRHLLSTMLDALQDEMKQALMLPFSSLFEVLPRMVRDLAREGGKEVELIVHGEGVEIDRRIQEQIKAPLIHLIRNAVDHGLETPAVRQRRNKAPAGRITVSVLPQEGNKVELCVADDGAGLDIEKIKRKALELGIMRAEELAHLTRKEATELIFESGLSTSPSLTDVSGRGLGMAIVREKIEKVGGTIEIENVESGGTRFRILLPVALATFRGLLVIVSGRSFILPSLQVESVCRLARLIGESDPQTITQNGVVLPLRRLSDILRLESGPPSMFDGSGRHLHIVVLSGAGTRIAVSVDEIVGDQEIVVKGLGPQLARIPYISAVTLLDGGKVVPILNVQDLMKAVMAHRRGGAPAISRPKLRSVLIVEDSATSRMQLMNILESAGYAVTATSDGVEALVALAADEFDLVISDIEMPRMDGFTLTARMRADHRLRSLPVVLLTTLDSPESREQGLAVGADAYIAKGRFEQGNLLDIIWRLL